jgi:GT2 family glycosyltransferase
VKLCVIILNYFGSADTIACLQSLAGQPVARVCVIENSGDDRELAMLRAAVTGHANVEIVPAGRNLGFAAGVNFALGRLLPLGFDGFILLNNDTVLPPDALGRLAAGAETAGLDIASPVINHYPDRHRLWSDGNYYHSWTGLLSAGKPALPGGVFYLPGCCLLVRRRVFEDAGLLDAAFFMYGEDVEFCHRAAGAGFRLGIVPDAVIYHKTGAASVQNSLFYEAQVNRGHLLLARRLFKSEGGRHTALCLKIFMLFLRACLRTARFRNSNALRGYAAALWDFLVR